MKRINNLLYAAFALLAATSCADNETDTLAARGPKVTGIVIAKEKIQTEAAVRAAATINGYQVNRQGDPTFDAADLSARTSWRLNVQMYDGEKKYAPITNDGAAVFIYKTTKSTWERDDTDLYFPNYTKQKIELTLYPNGWKLANTALANIAEDQSGTTPGSALLAQDVLTAAPLVNPAHLIGPFTLTHAHSMLDFILKGVNVADIVKVEVKITSAGSTPVSKTYIPYSVIAGSSSTKTGEYMLILPPDTKENPKVHITTQGGKVYIQTIRIIDGTKISQLGANTCYCFSMEGMDLTLSPISIGEWSTGEAINGGYVGVTEYPTFRGPINTSCELYYDNALVDALGAPCWQPIQFNSRGECTVKPDGRTITKIRKEIGGTKKVLTLSGVSPIPAPIYLLDMIVDLNAALAIADTNWQEEK